MEKPTEGSALRAGVTLKVATTRSTLTNSPFPFRACIRALSSVSMDMNSTWSRRKPRSAAIR